MNIISTTATHRFSLRDIITRILMDHHENFMASLARAHENLNPVDAQGYDKAADIEQVNLEVLHPSRLPALPRTLNFVSDGPSEIFLGVLSDLTSLYSTPEHYEYQYKYNRFGLSRSLVLLLDGDELANQDPHTAVENIKRAFAVKGATVLVTRLNALSTFKPTTAERGFHNLSGTIARAALMREIQDPERQSLVVLGDTPAAVSAFYDSRALADFYDYMFQHGGSPFHSYSYLQYFIRLDSNRKRIAESLRGSNPHTYHNIIMRFEDEIRPLLVNENQTEKDPQATFYLPKYTGSNLAIQIFSLFDRNDFKLTQAARDCFMHHVVGLSLENSGTVFERDVDQPTVQQEIDMFVAETIGFALERICDENRDDELQCIFNILMDDQAHMPRIKRVVEEKDVLNAVDSLSGLKTGTRRFFRTTSKDYLVHKALRAWAPH